MSEPLEQLHKPVDLLSMPLAKARVEIAKDVIAALSLGVIRPAAHSSYFYAAFKSFETAEKARDEDRELRDVFAKEELKTCEVCALGALFVAKIGRLDSFKLHRESVSQIGSTSLHGGTIKDQLNTFFSYEQMTLIECAFEISDHHARSLLADVVTAATRFGEEYTNDRSRLVAIMENIIQNNGEFCP